MRRPPERVRRDTSALVVGGGVAGISAAVVLAERGVRVTVLEGRSRLGGRLDTRAETLADGTAQPVDHGFHAFFRQYHNLRAILRRIDPALDLLRPVPGYPVLHADWPAEDFGRLPARPPWNLLALLARSPSLRLRDLRRMDGRAALPLLAYHPRRTYADLDHTTAEELLDALRLPDRARAMLFEVFSHSFFNHEAELSAAELVANFHFYFLGNPEGLAFDAPDRDYESAIWQPLAEYLRRHGARIQLDEPVTSVVPDDGGGWRLETGSGARYRARDVVLAVDPPALVALLAGSPELTARAPVLAGQVARLGTGPPYAVARYWLAGDVATDRAVFSGVSRQPTLDSVTLYHRLESEARQWAARTGGSVLELHAYACPDGVPAAELARRMLAELAGLWPEVADLPVRDLRCRVERQAPAFRPGDSADRPGVRTDADRLYLAGDGIRTELPSALLERAALTGMLAANHILRRAGAATTPIRTIPHHGLLARRHRRS
ncbi:hydroxysqualene dehydroxylase [Plantactinospora endophytica]|uniref:Dehydrogenase n=1 Tax=Plantactinospora endophytica TaxID=673535 RepID=A0ABQ4DSA8_9ACTN|nr:FAD-dependent oxidoreductase [Plantactinospora endophytica]GIG85326.1 dehydrogenase [Plantactinospora endophytica]